MNILELKGIIREIGYEYVPDGNGIAIPSTGTILKEVVDNVGNKYIQILGGICPINEILTPNINRVNQYFERRNANFQYGNWIRHQGNNRMLIERLPASNFDNLPRLKLREAIRFIIAEFSKENDAVILDLMLGKI
jgi:hypothetical protein